MPLQPPRHVWMRAFTDRYRRLDRGSCLPEGVAASPASESQSAGAVGATKDVVYPGGGITTAVPTDAATKTDQPTPLPAATLPSVDRILIASRQRVTPRDSDDAALDAIAANGQPLALPDAIKLAFRFQPRLRASLRPSPKPAACSRSRSRHSCPWSRPIMMSASSAWAWRAIRSRSGRACRDSIHTRRGAVPVGLNIGTIVRTRRAQGSMAAPRLRPRLGRYEQARLANDIAGLQTDRAYQTVANEVAVAYYNVLRSQALRRTAQDALRRSEEELADARKREREGVIEREVVLRAEVQTGGERFRRCTRRPRPNSSPWPG